MMQTSGSNTSISGRKKMCCLCLITAPLTAPLLLVGTFKKFLVFHHRASKRRMFKRLIVFHLVFYAFIFDSLWLLYDALICAYFEARQCYSHIVSTALYVCTVYAGKGFWGGFVPFCSSVWSHASFHPSACSVSCHTTATDCAVYKDQDKQQTWLNSDEMHFNTLPIMLAINKTIWNDCFVMNWDFVHHRL